MGVKVHQSLYVSAALAQWGFQMARRIVEQQKQERCSYWRSAPRRSGHVWGCHVCLGSPSYLLFIWLSEAAASTNRDHYTSPITTYLC